MVELLVADRLQVGCVFERRPPTSEESVRTLLRDDRHTGGSDAIYLGGHPHPRAYGAFGRLLGRHVRELGDWTWPQAVVHLAARPADRFGLAGRGRVREGFVADLVQAVSTPKILVVSKTDIAARSEIAVRCA